MEEKLSSARTISEADLATAVPEPMAMPISAFFRAGASFTPSPVWSARQEVQYFLSTITFTIPTDVTQSYHGSNVIITLQELNNLGLVGRLDTGEATCPADSLRLFMEGQVIKLTSSVGLSRDILILSKDANTTADSNSSSLVIACLEQSWLCHVSKLHILFLFFQRKHTDQ
ncbi:hypothetical protein NL108_016611 [Boleophthalmus pectinirostris]|nr:hypothetical protein NL108_016611 [Boleophthalmus pectinirostris]